MNSSAIRILGSVLELWNGCFACDLQLTKGCYMEPGTRTRTVRQANQSAQDECNANVKCGMRQSRDVI